MATQSEPKRHHYVPECYLRNFMREDKFYYLNIPDAKQRPKEFARQSHPSNICYHYHYYKSPEEHEQSLFSLSKWDKLFVESKVLHELETSYGQLFTSITSQQEICIEDANQFCDFIIQLKMRNPYYAAQAYSIKKVEETMDILLKTIEGENGPFAHLSPEIKKQVAQEYINNLKENSNLEKELQLGSLIHSHENVKRREKFRDVLCGLTWQVLKAPDEGPYFMTSDNPGFVIDKNSKIENIRLKGDGYFFLPLSSQHCLAIDLSVKESENNIKAGKKRILHKKNVPPQVERVNFMTSHLVTERIICCDREQLNLFAKNMVKPPIKP